MFHVCKWVSESSQPHGLDQSANLFDQHDVNICLIEVLDSKLAEFERHLQKALDFVSMNQQSCQLWMCHADRKETSNLTS